MKTGEAYTTSRDRRVFDVVGALALGTVSSPLAAVAAAAVCIERRTFNPIFKQTRIGAGGKEFTIYKFESIEHGANTDKIKTFGSDDPRATRVGKVLRKVSFDEWPQFWNVLKGDMSLVGQRPQIETVREERKSVVAGALWDLWCAQGNIRVGMEGPGQELAHIYDRYTEDDANVISHILETDVEYDMNASLLSDAKLILGMPFRLAKNYARNAMNRVREAVFGNPEEVILPSFDR